LFQNTAFQTFRTALTDLLHIVLGYRAGEWRSNQNLLERPEFRPLRVTSQAKLPRWIPRSLLPVQTGSLRTSNRKMEQLRLWRKFASREITN